MKAWEILDKAKKMVRLEKRIAELQADIKRHERYDPDYAKELREYQLELREERDAIEAELQVEYDRLATRRGR